MKLKKNSFTCKLYKFVYGTNILPETLCNYFWKVIFMYAISIPLFAFISIPYLVGLLFNNNVFFPKKYDSFFDKIVNSLFIYILLVLIIASIAGIFFLFPISYPFVKTNPGVFIGCFSCTICLFISILAYCYNKFVKSKKKIKTNKTNLIKEYVKTKKQKYCPKIEWIE